VPSLAVAATETRSEMGDAVSERDEYAVTIDGPDGTRVRRLYSGPEVRLFIAGPEQPHAKAAYLASIEIQAAFERGELGMGSSP
jgi:hypothetical protein